MNGIRGARERALGPVGLGAGLVPGAATGRVWRGAVTLLAGGVPRPGTWRGGAGGRRI